MQKIVRQVASKLFVLFAWLDGKSAREIADMVQVEGNYERFRHIQQELKTNEKTRSSGSLYRADQL